MPLSTKTQDRLDALLASWDADDGYTALEVTDDYLDILGGLYRSVVEAMDDLDCACRAPDGDGERPTRDDLLAVTDKIFRAVDDLPDLVPIHESYLRGVNALRRMVDNV